MSYVTRFGFTHPDTAPEMNSAVWFNLGRIEYWQYREQQRCDVLWWYESPSKHIGWRTTVKRVERFPYASLDDADTGMNDLFDKDIDPGTSGEKPTRGIRRHGRGGGGGRGAPDGSRSAACSPVFGPRPRHPS